LKLTAKRRARVLEYHIKRCLGPCVKGLCTPEEYQEAVRDVRMLLEGRNTELASKLEERMLHASDGMRYELAAKYRDLRKTVIKLSEQQKMATTSESDIDIFGYYREGQRLALQLFTMREGDIVGRREFFWEELSETYFNPAEFLSEVLSQYYSSASGPSVSPGESHAQDARATTGVDLHRPDARPPSFMPREIHVPIDFADRELLEKVLTERKGRRVHILAPQRGEKRDMIDLVEKNAKLAFEQRFRVLKPDMKRVLEEMQETLELPRFPARIESFDVSHIQGSENVAGMVVCENGKMNRNEYRKFKNPLGRRGPTILLRCTKAVLRRYRACATKKRPYRI
jgi:excinuclease ABC subunit C